MSIHTYSPDVQQNEPLILHFREADEALDVPVFEMIRKDERKGGDTKISISTCKGEEGQEDPGICEKFHVWASTGGVVNASPKAHQHRRLRHWVEMAMPGVKLQKSF